MGNVGIIGRARVGKDTAGAWLVDNRGYRRIGFADPLKEAALKLDPIVHPVVRQDGAGTDDYRLSDVVGEYSRWEAAKDDVPEVRRILQELGAAIRAIDPEFWLRAALAKVQEANEAGVPAVITDVRYPNEAESLRRAGFHLVYIDRPGVPQLDHESEGALTAEDADYLIHNDGDRAHFLREVEHFSVKVERFESRRHHARIY
ncbi:deoxynucleotide monophosphate kinase family protein [Streptomyces sp. NPDC003027]